MIEQRILLVDLVDGDLANGLVWYENGVVKKGVKLQYRQKTGEFNANIGRDVWSEWIDVPTVKEE